MASKRRCAVCGCEEDVRYNPMRDWDVKGPMCGGCYSKRLHEFYPGDHVRVNTGPD